MPQPIPPSPNAASLGKYGEIPVGKYTGIPEINIPLYQIAEGDIQIPISFSYHASGIKVEENASWVGLGWSLNAGGVITRSVRGKPDEEGYLNTSGANNQMPALLAGNTFVLAQSASICEIKSALDYACEAGGNPAVAGQSGKDSEPDIYFFNFNGISGKFVLDQNGVAYTIPYQKIKIERILDGIYIKWRITTTDGMQYEFGTDDTARESTYYSSLQYTAYGGSQIGSPPTSTYTSSWYLSSVHSPTAHTVSFNYVKEIYLVRSGFSQSLTWDISDATSFNASNYIKTNGSLSEIHGSRLSSITFTNGRVDFLATQTRQDVEYNQSPGPLLLGKIAISNLKGIIKNFVLNTDYFTTGDGVNDLQNRRLRLNSVTETNGDLTLSKMPYTFSYDNSGYLPAKISSSQDHWGYYNGKVNKDADQNPTLIPNINQGTLNLKYEKFFTYVSMHVISESYYNLGVQLLQFKGADRTPDFNFAKIGVLNKIAYPTGGYTLFEYEPHDYDLKPDNYVYANQKITTKAFAVTDPDYNTLVPVDDRMTVVNNVYEKIRTVNVSQYINAGNSSLNQTVFADLNFKFDNDGQNFYCCGFSEPTAIFKDVTLNKILIQANGREADIYLDPSIQDQINDQTITPTGNFVPTDYPNGIGWNSVPNFNFSPVRLDPTHTYELKSTAYYSPAVSCESRQGCPEPAQEPLTNAALQMDLYINSNVITQYNGEIGGLRIKKISDYTSSTAAPIVKLYTYRLSANPLISSGVASDFPLYMDSHNKLHSEPNNGHLRLPVTQSGTVSKVFSVISGSKFELGQTSGSFIGYKEVKESYCADGSCTGTPVGFKIYKYTSTDDYADVNTQTFCNLFRTNPHGPCEMDKNEMRIIVPGDISTSANVYPYPPKNNYDWKRGLPISEETFDSNGLSKQKLETTYNLVSEPNNSKIIDGLKIASMPTPDGISCNLYTGQYKVVAAWNYKTQDKLTEKDAAGNAIVTTTNYFYDNPDHAMVTRTETVNSKGETLQEKNKYVGDEAAMSSVTATAAAAITKLKTQFRYATLLEREENKNGMLMSRVRTNYKDWSNNFVAPEFAEMQIAGNPVEARVNYQQYDNTNGNLLQVNKITAPTIAYQWGYNKQYPVAMATNAKNNDIFYDSFEEGNSNGTAEDAKTGHYSHSGPYSKALTGLDAGKYKLTYWQYSGTAWVLITTPVTVTGTTYTISINAKIDDVRFYPADAQMTTYTYDPLIGITSSTDAKGMVSYYEYDSFQRLLNIKDQYGNILKNYDYHYRPQ